jgi:NTE family protein
MKEFNKIAFSTGGIKGISFIGCIKALEERNIINNINFFAGSSIGSLIALLLSIGFKSNEMFTTLKRVNLDSLREIKITGILDTFGISDTNRIGTLIKFCLMEKGLSSQLTFKQLYDIKKNVLIITGTNVNSRESHYFNYIDTPDMQIATALKISMCIPFFFNAVSFNKNLYVDGGLMDPLPSIYLNNFNKKNDSFNAENSNNLEKNEKNENDEDEDDSINLNNSNNGNVIALNINNSITKSCSKIEDLETFAISITACVLQKINSLIKDTNIPSISQINIDTDDYSAIDFNIKENDIVKLIDLGYDQTKNWIDNFDLKLE